MLRAASNERANIVMAAVSVRRRVGPSTTAWKLRELAIDDFSCSEKSPSGPTTRRIEGGSCFDRRSKKWLMLTAEYRDESLGMHPQAAYEIVNIVNGQLTSANVKRAFDIHLRCRLDKQRPYNAVFGGLILKEMMKRNRIQQRWGFRKRLLRCRDYESLPSLESWKIRISSSRVLGVWLFILEWLIIMLIALLIFFIRYKDGMLAYHRNDWIDPKFCCFFDYCITSITLLSYQLGRIDNVRHNFGKATASVNELGIECKWLCVSLAVLRLSLSNINRISVTWGSDEITIPWQVVPRMINQEHVEGEGKKCTIAVE